MNTVQLDRMDLAQGVMDATADLREFGLPAVVKSFAGLANFPPTTWRDGYFSVLAQAELVAWDQFMALRTTQPTHVR